MSWFNKNKTIVMGTSAVATGALVGGIFLTEDSLQEAIDYVVHNIGDYVDGVPEITNIVDLTKDLVNSGPFEFEPVDISYDSSGQPFDFNSQYFHNNLQRFSEKFADLAGVGNNSYGEKLVTVGVMDHTPQLTEDGFHVDINPEKLQEGVRNLSESGLYEQKDLAPVEEARVLKTLAEVDLHNGSTGIEPVLPEVHIISKPNEINLENIKDGLTIMATDDGDNISSKAVNQIVKVLAEEHNLSETQSNRLYVHILNRMVENNEGLTNPDLIHPGDKLVISLNTPEFRSLIDNGDSSFLNDSVNYSWK